MGQALDRLAAAYPRALLIADSFQRSPEVVRPDEAAEEVLRQFATIIPPVDEPLQVQLMTLKSGGVGEGPPPNQETSASTWAG